MDRIEKLKEYLNASGKDSFLQHALALEYIKIGDDLAAKDLFNDILRREPTYVGSYYHLAKVLERLGDIEKAIRIYERGLEEAKAADDTHTYNELRAAYDDLIE